MHWTSPFLSFHKYAISFDIYVLISSANIPAELHGVVNPFTRPSFHFSLSNFPKWAWCGGSGDETICRLLPYERCLSLTTLCVDMTKERRRYSALRLQELSKRVCSLSSFIDRDGGAELVWGWRGWVQVEPKAHRAAAVSPFSRVIDRSFGVALLATI